MMDEERCVICGEPEPDAEMHDPAVFDLLEGQWSDREHGLVHAQCGLERGWEVS